MTASPTGEEGFTLIELLIATTLALVIFAATLQLLVAALHKQIAVANKVAELGQAQVGEARLVRDLRQASNVNVVSSSSITYSEPVGAGTASVSFSCSTGTSSCTRTVSGTARTAITNVTNSDVFTASPSSSSPTYVGIKLVISGPSVATATITDGIDLRNVTLGN